MAIFFERLWGITVENLSGLAYVKPMMRGSISVFTLFSLILGSVPRIGGAETFSDSDLVGCIAADGLAPGDHASKEALPAFTNGPFANRWLRFSELPANLKDGTLREFCFPLSDPRSAFVQTYHHGSMLIHAFSRALDEAGFEPLPQIEINLQPVENGMPPNGESFGGKINFTYVTSRPIDVSILAHELGHEVHRHLAKGTDYDLLKASALTSRDFARFADIQTISEGTANILAALIRRDPVFGSGSYLDASIDLSSSFVTIQNMPKLRGYFERFIRADKFGAAYPGIIDLYRGYLKEPSMQAWLDLHSDGYLSSAVFTQPLWLVAQEHGFDSVLTAYLRGLNSIPRLGSLQEFGQSILDASVHDSMVYEDLSKHLRERGLIQ